MRRVNTVTTPLGRELLGVDGVNVVQARTLGSLLGAESTEAGAQEMEDVLAEFFDFG